MKTIEILAMHRPHGSKSALKQLRTEGHVPCVVYGANTKHTCCAVPQILFRELVYTDSAHFVRLNLEGDCMDCILQDIQFHPTSDSIIHADFFILDPKRVTMMAVPVRCEGTAVGVGQGGKLLMHLRTLRVKGLPKQLPAQISIAVEALDIGHSIRVSDLPKGAYTVLEPSHLPLVSVQIPKALRKAQDEDAVDDGTVEAHVEEASSTETPSVQK